MMEIIIKRLRLARLRKAIATCERAGLAVVQVKRTENAVYLVGSKGSYVRFDKTKPCRVNPHYSGPSNCELGTVGCTIPEHRNRP